MMMKSGLLRSVSLIGLKETSRHTYEGTVSADMQGNRFILPFMFSDMSGNLQFRKTEDLRKVPFSIREEIAGRSTDLVLDRIVSFEF